MKVVEQLSADQDTKVQQTRTASQVCFFCDANDGSVLLSLVLLIAAAFFILSAPRAYAQQIYGTLTGNIQDSSGAAVSSAKVTVSEVDKGIRFSAPVSSSGLYTKGQLIPGRYTVAIEAPGFTKVVSTLLTVGADGVTRFNATLSPGSAEQTVQVTDKAPLLQTDSADVATDLTAHQVVTLPDYQRNFLALEFLTPGVINSFGSTPSAENPEGSFRAQVNGQIQGTTNYELDGTDNDDAWLGTAIINPNPDSVAEAKFSTENFNAENGFIAGGMFAITTKSGTNQLHGSLFDYLINNSPGFRTVASNPFTQPDGAPPLKSNQFGGSLGGKIIPNKLFFFGDLQVQRRSEGDTLLTTVPTQQVRDTCLTGTGFCDLSQYISNGQNQIYDPATGDPASGRGRTPFAGNLIRASRISPQAQNILKYFPAPNTEVGGVPYRNNYIASGNQSFDSEQFDTREDYYPNERSNFFGRYTFVNYSLSVPGAFGVLAGGPGLDSSGYSGNSSIRNQSLSLGYNRTFSPTFLNELRFGWYRYNVHEVPGGYGTQPATQAGIPGLNLDTTYTSGFPAFNITGDGGAQLGYSLTVNRCNCPLTERETEFQILDNVTRQIGNHTLKFGADLRRNSNLRAPSDNHRSGELTFAPGYTGLGNANGSAVGGLGLATFLLGQTTSFARYVSQVNDATAFLDRAEFYAQDTWQATPKLTLNYGLRWELIFPEATAAGKGGLLNLNTGNVVVFGIGGNSSRGFQKMVYTHLAPRIGLSYRLTPTTVLRSGYGWAYDIGWAGTIFNDANIQLPVLLAQSNTPANSTQGVFNLANGPATPVFPTIQSNGQFRLPNNISQSTRPVTETLPRVMAYNAAIQQQFTRKVSVTAAYVGNSARHTVNGDNGNFNVNQAAFVPGVSNQNTLKPYYAKYGWTQAINYFCDCAVSQYNSFQGSVNIRNAGGYSATGTYVWEYAYGDAGTTVDAYTMLYDRKLGHGNFASIPHHQIILQQDYQLPFGRSRRFGAHLAPVAQALAGGWELTGVTSFLSGEPFTVGIGTYPTGYAFPSVGINYPDRGSVSPFQGAAHNRTQWFKGGLGTAFLLPAPNTFGNYGFNNLHGPSYIDEDLSTDKHFSLGEHYVATIRASAYNLFNHTNLGLPNTNITDPKAGQITSIASGANMRRLQFAFRVDF